MTGLSLVFTAGVTVFDEEALRRAACAQAAREGLSKESWVSLRQGMASDLIMLLDPGSIPGAGFEIRHSVCEANGDDA
ncbi:hypothetical protein [Variovorax paradoxus]|uniref:hypothetical protein n=1 Tax=Variovorax paradoxus TaxID=34073 RepID=UPI003ECFEC11